MIAHSPSMRSPCISSNAMDSSGSRAGRGCFVSAAPLGCSRSAGSLDRGALHADSLLLGLSPSVCASHDAGFVDSTNASHLSGKSTQILQRLCLEVPGVVSGRKPPCSFIVHLIQTNRPNTLGLPCKGAWHWLESQMARGRPHKGNFSRAGDGAVDYSRQRPE